MKQTKTEMLDELWELVVQHNINQLKSGKAAPSDVANAIKMLKEGIIDELKDEGNDVARDLILSDVELPFDDVKLN